MTMEIKYITGNGGKGNMKARKGKKGEGMVRSQYGRNKGKFKMEQRLQK